MKKFLWGLLLIISLFISGCTKIELESISIARIYQSDLGEKYNTCGVVVGKNKESFIIEDDTDRILVYLGNTWDSTSVQIGDNVNVNGVVDSYANSRQFTKDTTVEVVKHEDYTYPNPSLYGKTQIESLISLNIIKPEFVLIEGLLNIDGDYCNLIIEETSVIGSIAYPISKSELQNYNNKKVKLYGYVTSIVSDKQTNKYLNIVYTKINLVDSIEDISDGNCNHNFIGDSCIACGTIYNEFIFNLYGEDTIIYTNDVENPYDIDLNLYGSDIQAVFYNPDLDSFADPYGNVNKIVFYNNYTEATSYEDAYYRTKHHLISGDITPQGHIPATIENNSNVRCSTATYVLDYNGNYLAYIPNSLDGKSDIIYYGAGYTELNEVSAYLLAFGKVPANNNYNKNSSGQSEAIADWGIYGRVNFGSFSGDTSKYPYEPKLPNISNIRYFETDFGTIGGYINQNKYTGAKYNQTEYNTGNKISRGAARFCFVGDSSIKSIDKRYVFYTYNHYNDFQEYLNYINGFGSRFGNESAGNPYCSSSSDYYKSSNYVTMQTPTLYPNPIILSIYEMLK